MIMNKVDEIAKSLGFRVERQVECVAFYYLVDENGNDKRNAKGEKLCLEISRSEDPGGKNSLPRLWYKAGETKEIMRDWWNVSTFVTNKKGECYDTYNPTWKMHPNPFIRRRVINFDWMLRATEENFRKLIEEVLRQFYT